MRLQNYCEMEIVSTILVTSMKILASFQVPLLQIIINTLIIWQLGIKVMIKVKKLLRTLCGAFSSNKWLQRLKGIMLVVKDTKTLILIVCQNAQLVKNKMRDKNH